MFDTYEDDMDWFLGDYDTLNERFGDTAYDSQAEFDYNDED